MRVPKGGDYSPGARTVNREVTTGPLPPRDIPAGRTAASRTIRPITPHPPVEAVVSDAGPDRTTPERLTPPP